MTVANSDSQTPKNKSKSPLPIIIGAAVLILALIFGSRLLGGDGATATDSSVETAVETQVESIPDFFPAVVEGTPLTPGDLPYNFVLADLAGDDVSLNEFAGKPLVINVWASWCGPCRIEFPHLQASFEEHGDEIQFLALNHGENAETAIEYLDELELTIPTLLDQDKEVALSYGVGRTLPTTFFVNAAGEITQVHRGPLAPSQLEEFIDVILPNS